MRVGNVGGKGVVYKVVEKPDFQGLTVLCAGDILLRGGEKLLAVLPDQRIVFRKGGFGWGGGRDVPSMDGPFPFIDTDGPGSLYVTDARIVFLRRPDPKEIRRRHSGDGGGASILIAVAHRIMNANALEYFEVGHEEVVSLKQKRGGLSLYLLIDQEKHLLSLSTEAGEVLLPVLKKRLMVP